MCHWVLITDEMQRLTVWNEDIAADKARFKEVISDEVPLRPIKVDNKVWQWVAQPQTLVEVPGCLHECLHLIDTLGETCQTIIGLFLAIDMINQHVN